MPFVRINGLDTHYTVYGEGYPVALIHHLAGSTKSWFNQVPHLARDYRLIAYDLRGHGRSAEPTGPFSMGDLADDLFLLLRELGIERCAVVGHSIGGMIAPLFALKHPSMVGALAIVAGASQALSEERLAGYRVMREIAETKGMEALAEYRKANSQIPPKITDNGILWEHFKALYRETSVSGYVMTSEALATMPNLTGRMREIGCEMLGIVGDIDQVFMETMKMLAGNANITMRIMRGCGHFVMMEEPDEFNSIVTSFLSDYKLK